MTVSFDGNAVAIDAFLFDKDGTLLDSLGPWAAVELSLARRLVAARMELSILSPEVERQSEELAALLGITSQGVDRAGVLATGTADAILGTLERGLGSTFPTTGGTGSGPSAAFRAEAEAILAELLPDGPPPSPAIRGADSCLRALSSSGIPVGLVTSDDEDPTMADLARLGWTGLFGFISAADTAARAKPDPWPVLAFSRFSGIEPGRIAVVGDTDADFEMARAAGAAVFIRVRDTLDDLVPRLTEGLSFSTMGVYGREYPPIEIHRIL